MPHTAIDPPTPDPDLQAILDAGLDPDFEWYRARAREMLSEATIAFWVQAVGDGTPLFDDRHPFARCPIHHISFRTGFADGLQDPLLTMTATEFLAKQVAATVHRHPYPDPPDEVLHTLLSKLRSNATRPDSDLSTDIDPPPLGNLTSERSWALDLLEHERLTAFWVMTNMWDTSVEMRRLSPRPGDPAGMERFGVQGNQVLRHATSTPAALTQRITALLTLQFLSQHLVVVARMADRSIDDTLKEVVSYIKREGWLEADNGSD